MVLNWKQYTFDNVNFWKLFHKLLDDNIEWRIVRILAYWYSSQ